MLIKISVNESKYFDQNFGAKHRFCVISRTKQSITQKYIFFFVYIFLLIDFKIVENF